MVAAWDSRTTHTYHNTSNFHMPKTWGAGAATTTTTKLQHHSLHGDNTVSSNETKALDHWATHLHCCIQSFGMLELFQQLVVARHLLPFLVHDNHVILKQDTPKPDRK